MLPFLLITDLTERLMHLPDLQICGLACAGSWFPLVGDVFSLALGFYKTNPWLTAFLLLTGRALRFLVWNIVLGAV